MYELTLVFPDESFEEEAVRFKESFFANGEKTINGSALWDLKESFSEWLKMLRDNADPATVNPDWVVSSTFFATRNSDGRIIGVIDLRHYLNDFLKDFGHIGFSVIPSERKKGYATQMLGQMLEYANKQGLNEVQLACDTDNTASRKTIINHGGKFVRFFEHDGKKAEVFIILL